MFVTLSDNFVNRMMGTKIHLIKNLYFESCKNKCESGGAKMIDASEVQNLNFGDMSDTNLTDKKIERIALEYNNNGYWVGHVSFILFDVCRKLTTK